MKKTNFMLISGLILLLVLGLSVALYADDDDNYREEDRKMIARLRVNMSDPVLRMNKDFIPLHEVAQEIDYSLNWECSQDRVRGRLGNLNFSTSNFIIYRGELYIHESMFTPAFGLEVEIRGLRYYFYRYQEKEDMERLELKINTHTSSLDKRDPLAVSILLLNNTEDDIEIRFRSGQKYDLVLSHYGREVWRLSEGKGYIQSIIEQELDEGEHLLFTSLIKPNLDRGRYSLTAEIKTTEGVIRSDSVTLQFH